ncbi:unnamed protein product [Mytilus coruscus]|uniref:Mab-21-like nucleotidyltransferase domain-containing protein n=1 Tax=Mytilus coruscus TaxID=42192 RepID=A0A6J8BXU6_MYTCO|nr:unnamed protein product [Mytilus coruscus]
MQFLDVLVFKSPRFREKGILDLTTFWKKSENYNYSKRSSCNPASTFRGIDKGEMLRFKRCTNDPVDLQRQYALLSECLIKRRYKENEIKTVMQEVTAKQKNDTLLVKPKSILQSPPLYITDYNQKELINAKTKYGRTPLHEAALHGPAEKVLALLSNEALVDAEDSSGATSLHYIVSRLCSADITSIKAMITAGANVNKRNVYKQTPLSVACKHHQFMQKAIHIMIKAGADPGIQAIDGNTALHVLFFGNNLFKPQLTVADVEEIVTANRKCLETVNLFGELPVHCALSKCHSEEIILRLLSYSRGSLDLSDALGRTILHLACEKNYLQILENYLGNSISANKTDCLGRSILHYSCRFSKNGRSIKLILKSKAFNKFHQTDNFGFTAYQYARIRNTEVETKLLEVFKDHMETIIYMRNSELFKTDKPHRYSEIVKESKDLSMLLENIVVKSSNSFPSNLRPVKSAEDYVRQIWMTCNTPLKNMETFGAQKRKVENFMKKLIHFMAELDDRFSGTLVMRGSSYEGTIADERGDFDYVLVIDDLSSLCNVNEDENDPPGFVQIRLLPDKNPGIFREFFDADGYLSSEKVLSIFSLIVMRALNNSVLWQSSDFDFLPVLHITWKEKPALRITCSMFHLDTFVMLSIDFLPAIRCKGWWPRGNNCNMFLDRQQMDLGCEMIIKPPDVPYYQHARFGVPHRYLKMSFSEAETCIFEKSHANIRKALIVAKLLLDRNAEVPIGFIMTDLDEGDCLFNSRMVVQTRNCLKSFLLKQSLLSVLIEDMHYSHDGNKEDSLLVWVQRIYLRLQKSLKEGYLPSVFLPYINYLHTFQPDDSLENFRNVIVQIFSHSLLEEEIPLEIDHDVSWHRGTSSFERLMHSRFRYLTRVLQVPDERD